METISTIVVWLGAVAVFMYYRHRFSRSSASLNSPKVRSKAAQATDIRARA